MLGCLKTGVPFVLVSSNAPSGLPRASKGASPWARVTDATTLVAGVWVLEVRRQTHDEPPLIDGREAAGRRDRPRECIGDVLHLDP